MIRTILLTMAALWPAMSVAFLLAAPASRSRPAFVATSSETAPDVIASEQEQEEPLTLHQITSFVTPSMKFYREDADHNYLRVYERALELAAMPAGVSADPDWFVWGLTANTHELTPDIGTGFVVQGELVERNCEGVWLERWKVQMKRDDDEDDSAAAVYYNTAILTISAMPKAHQRLSHFYASPPLKVDNENSKTVSCQYTLFRDEFDPYLPNRIPLRSALQLFERARYSHFQEEEEDCTVTSITDCELCNPNLAGWGLEREIQMEDATLVQCNPGSKVTVQTEYAEKADSTVECRQTVLVSAFDAEKERFRNRRLAQGVVTVLLNHEKTQSSESDSGSDTAKTTDNCNVADPIQTSNLTIDEMCPPVLGVFSDEPFTTQTP